MMCGRWYIALGVTQMNPTRFAMLCVSILLVGQGSVLAEGLPDRFEVVAKLQKPEGEPEESCFRCAAVQFPWVYALATDGTRAMGRLHIFNLSEKLPERVNDEDEAPKVKPLAAIANFGDGECLDHWNGLLLVTQRGGLAVYSLDDPRQPKCRGRSSPSSGKDYLSQAIVHDRNHVYVIGRSVILCYDVSDPSKPQCIGEIATEYLSMAGCVSDARLYVGCSKKIGDDEKEGIAVFDLADPANPKELAFTALPRPVYHLFVLPEQFLLASTDGDSLIHSYSPPFRNPSGSALLLDLSDADRPYLLGEHKRSGARSATMIFTQEESYFVCEAAVFAVHGGDMEKVASFWDCGSTRDGSPYRGDNDGTYAALPNDETIVVLKRVPTTNPGQTQVPANKEG